MITLLTLRPYTGDSVAPSPNHGDRSAQAIEGIVLRATADAGNEARALHRLRSPRSRTSCHLLVNRAGRVTRLVGDRLSAMHAAGSHWRGQHDVDSVTLAIEIANRNDGEPYADAQYGRVAAIVAHYCRQGLALDDVVGHDEITGGAANPLGWDWERFRIMVQEQLSRTADAEARRSFVYDRRSADRRAADEVAAELSAEDAPPPPADDATDDPAEQRAADEAVVQRPAIVPPLSISPARASTPDERASPRSAPGTVPGAVPDAAQATTSAPRRPVAPATPRASRTLPRPEPRGAVSVAPKPLLRSRTIWLNGLMVLTVGSMLVGDTLDLAQRVGITVPEVLVRWALFFVGLVNIILRLRTTQPIGRPPELLEPAEQERMAVLGMARR